MLEKAPLCHEGNHRLFLAVEMSLVSTLAGMPMHIHAEGLRGTGKTTVMRWAKSLGPKIQRIKGCPFQCSPEDPFCGLHSGAKETPWDVEEIPMPFSEIGHGAKLGTILGSIDLKRLTDASHPEAALLPGTIPGANRGIIFIDEINRLAETAPEITDVLLSVMGTKPGKVVIEEVGLPTCEIPIKASVWAASNPDEEPGPLDEIRKQLADRFDLVVPVERPKDPLIVEELLLSKNSGWNSRHTSFDSPLISAKNILGQRTISPESLWRKAALLKNVTVPRTIVTFIASLYVQKNVESLRAIESLEFGARIVSALEEKTEVGYEELSLVVPLVLRHRVEPMVLMEILRDLELRKAASVQAKEEPSHRNAPPENPSETPKETRDDSDLPKAREDSSDSQSPVQNLSQNEKLSWFQRLIHGYQRAFSGHLKDSGNSGKKAVGGPSPENYTYRQGSHGAAPESGREINPQIGWEKGSGATSPSKETVFSPVSPPKPARRIGHLSWENIIMPPDFWKDGLP